MVLFKISLFLLQSMLQKILFSNFLGNNRQGSDNLKELLESKAPLSRLIDEDNFQSQFKSGTARIKQYLNYERFQELVAFVTVVGDETDKKRAFKHPLTACELLISENSQIDDLFLPVEGIVKIQEKVTKSVQKEVQQEVDDDEEEAQQKEEGEKAKQEKEGEEKIEEKDKQAKPEEDQFGQFVTAPEKKKKIIKVKEVVDIIQTVERQKQPLINKFFQYFAQPINYTLTGYVCKVMVNLLNRRTKQFLSKLFDNTDQSASLFQSFFEHLGSRSMVDFLTRLFTIENVGYLDQRYEVLFKMIEYLGKSEQLDTLSNIVACVSESIEKLTAHFKTVSPLQELSIYTTKTPEILQKLLEFVVGENELSASYSISIICLFLSSFNLTYESDKLKDWLNSYVEGAVKKLSQYLNEERPRLGVVGFRLLESFNIYLKVEELGSCFAENKQLFPSLIGLLKKYPFNNIFHFELFKFFTTILESLQTQSAKNLIQNGPILDWLEEQAKIEEDRRKRERQLPKTGYYGHLFNFCNLLKENKNKNKDIEELIKNERFSYITSILVEKQAKDEEKMLAGYEKKKLSHRIMSDKESILQTHATFLSSAPPAVYEKDPEDPLSNPTLLEELQKQLDGVEISNQQVPKQVVEEEHHKAELIEQNAHHKNAFWKVHLDYDIDGLIDELA